MNSAYKQYLDIVELYSFEICGFIFLMLNIFVIWWVRVNRLPYTKFDTV